MAISKFQLRKSCNYKVRLNEVSILKDYRRQYTATAIGGLIWHNPHKGGHSNRWYTSRRCCIWYWPNWIAQLYLRSSWPKHWYYLEWFFCSMLGTPGWWILKLNIPNNQQVFKIYANNELMGWFNTGYNNNNFRNCSYWSAEANGPTNAWVIYFTTGGMCSNCIRTYALKL